MTKCKQILSMPTTKSPSLLINVIQSQHDDYTVTFTRKSLPEIGTLHWRALLPDNGHFPGIATAEITRPKGSKAMKGTMITSKGSHQEHTCPPTALSRKPKTGGGSHKGCRQPHWITVAHSRLYSCLGCSTTNFFSYVLTPCSVP